MKGMDRFEAQPARDAAEASMRSVEAGDRDGWLALFSDDAVVEDPIGPSPFDADGFGHKGLAAIAAFYDTVISNGSVYFTITDSYASGNECANVGTITTTFADGSRAVVDGVYTYRVDDSGKLCAIRAFWEFDKISMIPASTD